MIHWWHSKRNHFFYESEDYESKKKECIQTRWIKCITTIVDALSVPITSWDYSFLSDLPDSRFSPALHYPKSIIPNANKVIFLKLKKLRTIHPLQSIPQLTFPSHFLYHLPLCSPHKAPHPSLNTLDLSHLTA